MRKVPDTIARLSAFRTQQNLYAVANALADRLQEFTSFGSNPGALRARYYLPENLPEEAPLVVVLHGCTQSAAGYDRGSGWSQLADQAGFALLFPEQQRANNPNLCFNWFLPDRYEAQRRGSALDTSDDRNACACSRPRSETHFRHWSLGRRRDGLGDVGNISGSFCWRCNHCRSSLRQREHDP